MNKLMKYSGEKLDISFAPKEQADDYREDVLGSVKDSVDSYKISDLFGNLNQVNVIMGKTGNNNGKAMKIKSSRIFSCTFWVLLMFFKFIGLATFVHCIVTQHKRTLNRFQYSKLGIAYNIILASLLIGLNFISIPYMNNISYEEKTNFTTILDLLQSIFGVIMICMTLFNYCIDQKRLVRIANQLMDVEYEINRLYQLYHPFQRQRIQYMLIVTFLTKVCLLIILLITDVLAFHTNPISWMTDIVPSFHVGWLIMQYFLLMTIIQADFADVNYAIQDLSKTSRNEMRFWSPPLCQTRRVVVSNSIIYQLLQLRDVHCHLCDICQDVSHFYSLPMLFGIAFIFFSLIYNAYYLIFPLITLEFLQGEVLLNTIFWLIFLVFPIFLLTNRISNVLKEIGKTGNIVHNILRYTLGKEVKSELKQFSLQLLHCKIRFTVNEYFNIDNAFFHSMIGTMVTYLVILVQFEMANSCSKSQYNYTKENTSSN